MRLRTAILATALLPVLTTGVFAVDPDFNLVNKTGSQIDEIYISQHGANRWGPDIMKTGALGDNQQAVITFPRSNAACQFDIKVKYHDGKGAEWGNIDLCKYQKISLMWDDATKSTRAIAE